MPPRPRPRSWVETARTRRAPAAHPRLGPLAGGLHALARTLHLLPPRSAPAPAASAQTAMARRHPPPILPPRPSPPRHRRRHRVLRVSRTATIPTPPPRVWAGPSSRSTYPPDHQAVRRGRSRVTAAVPRESAAGPESRSRAREPPHAVHRAPPDRPPPRPGTRLLHHRPDPAHRPELFPDPPSRAFHAPHGFEQAHPA
jgi:hypothetical protein